MAQIVLDIPDDQADRVLDAFVGRYLPADGSVPRPTTRAQKAAFVKGIVADQIKQIVMDYERKQRERAALEAVVVPPGVNIT